MATQRSLQRVSPPPVLYQGPSEQTRGDQAGCRVGEEGEVAMRFELKSLNSFVCNSNGNS